MKTAGSVKKFFSGILLVATLLGAFHHHHDLKTHHNCPICTFQSNISSGDLPETFDVAQIENLFVPITSSFETLKLSSKPTRLSARSPPLFF
ncbi:hypothetical protein [Hydrogenimonas cancrithermarum]|uniref:Uncharacterized protein n=1 Tax=Hydrogenimonas cancrithermarum TaxID=2993563 RepID=A0ABM8FHY2_9BACT|nr:hypothetical protein [Hydrogenimonas cancrithermarum]BDY11889.1 hypothetical protein HCR_02010 [Hydrogenimonas cancrithermarum]